MNNKIIPFPKERTTKPKTIPGDNKIIYLVPANTVQKRGVNHE